MAIKVAWLISNDITPQATSLSTYRKLLAYSHYLTNGPLNHIPDISYQCHSPEDPEEVDHMSYPYDVLRVITQ